MKKVLIIIPYENIYPPMNGGMQRCLHILIQAAKFFEVTAIIHQPSGDFLKSVLEFPVLKRVNIFSIRDFKVNRTFFSVFSGRLQLSLRFKWLMRSLTASADSNFLKYVDLLKHLLKTSSYDAIILENFSTLNAVPFLRRYTPGSKLIFDAHNIETKLILENGKNVAQNPSLIKAIMKVESSFHRKIDGLLVCSHADMEGFRQLNKKPITAAVIPNGVILFPTLRDREVRGYNPRYIIFCGTLSYPPNVEGLLWFYASIWPLIKHEIPGLKLIVVGSGTASTVLNELKQASDVLFLGRVDDVKEYYNQAAVSVVPLKKGSGTRLKILEAMSLGIPVVSTSKGAEGIEYKKNKNIAIAETEAEFAAGVIDLIQKKDQRLLLQKNARELIAKKYDWDVIGIDLRQFINNLVHN